MNTRKLLSMLLIVIAGTCLPTNSLLAEVALSQDLLVRPCPNIYDYPTTFQTNHGLYICNVATGKFISMGEAWSTQSCVVNFNEDASGNHPFTYYIKNDPQEGTTLPEGTYYLWSPDAHSKGWLCRINNDSKAGNTCTCFSDGTASHFKTLRVAWEIEPKDATKHTYYIKVPTSDPNGHYIQGCALGVDPSHYSNVANPTYALYWDIPEANAGCEWIFYDADAYNNAYEIYISCAPALLEMIKIAIQNEVDDSLIATAIAIYNNPDATKEEFLTQQKILEEALLRCSSVSPSVDVTDLFIVNPNPYANTDGWETPKGQPNAFDPVNRCAEFWNLSGYSLQQTLHNLPEGLYELEAQAFTRTNMHATLSVGDYSMEIATIYNSIVNNRKQSGQWFDEGNGLNKLLFVQEKDSADITVSLTSDNNIGDRWMVWRGFRLLYLGRSIEKSYKPYLLNCLPNNWREQLADTVYTPSYLDAMEQELADVDSITTIEEAVNAIKELRPLAALNALWENVKAWNDFAVWYEELCKVVRKGSEYEAPLINFYDDKYPSVIMLIDSMEQKGDMWMQWYKEKHIMENVLTEELEDFIAESRMLLYNALWEIYPPSWPTEEYGDITTQFVANPSLSYVNGELWGWTVDTGLNEMGIQNKAPVKGADIDYMLEARGYDFDMYQDIVLPGDGEYQIILKGLYLTCSNAAIGAANNPWTVWNAAQGTNTGANQVCAFLYVDDQQVPLANACIRTYSPNEIEGMYEDVKHYFPLSLQDYLHHYQLVEGDVATGRYIPTSIYSAYSVFDNSMYRENYVSRIKFFGQEKKDVRIGVKGVNMGIPTNDIGYAVFGHMTLTRSPIDPTGIAEPVDFNKSTQRQSSNIYDLSGRRADGKKPGVYIKNGKLILVK